MDTKQIKSLALLAKKQKKEKRSSEQILHTFVAAGILTATGNYTKHYASLNIEKTATPEKCTTQGTT